jgi:hypothetical protein
MPFNHYFVSQFYQRFWSANGRSVWAHFVSRRTSERVRTDRLMQEDDLYTDPETGDDPLERRFDREVETRAAPILRAMIAGQRPTISQRNLVAFFISSLEVRSPRARDLALPAIQEYADDVAAQLRGDEGRLRAWLEEVLREANLPHELTPIVLREFVTGQRGIPVDVSNWHDLIWQIATIFAQRYTQDSWTLVSSGGALEFYSSDAPVTTASQEHGPHLKFRYFHTDASAFTLFPISPELFSKVVDGES